MDAIQLIRRDHRAIEALLQRCERASTEEDVAGQRRAVRELVRELSVHAEIEEQILYPALRAEGVEDGVLDALEEHHAVKLTLAELERASPRDGRFWAKVRLVAANVRQHVEEEEAALLPALEGALDPAALRELGAALELARHTAPTRPHPAAPDTPPGNVVAGTVAAILDRSRDALRGGGEMLRLVAGRGARGGRQAARGAVERVGRGREAFGELREAGRDAAREARGAIDELEERGRRGARRVQEAAQTSARTVGNGAGRASNNGVERAARTQAPRRRRSKRGARRGASR